MRRMVLGAEDGKVGKRQGRRRSGRHGCRRDGAASRDVRRVRAGAGRGRQPRPGRRRGRGRRGGRGRSRRHAPGAGRNRWVVTTREQRRAWDLPDLEGDGPVGPGPGGAVRRLGTRRKADERMRFRRIQ